jgi:hypothetical protein
VPDFLRLVRRRRRFETDTLKDWWLTQLAGGLLGLVVCLATGQWMLAGLAAFIALYALLIIAVKTRRARGRKWS